MKNGRITEMGEKVRGKEMNDFNWNQQRLFNRVANHCAGSNGDHNNHNETLVFPFQWQASIYDCWTVSHGPFLSSIMRRCRVDPSIAMWFHFQCMVRSMREIWYKNNSTRGFRAYTNANGCRMVVVLQKKIAQTDRITNCIIEDDRPKSPVSISFSIVLMKKSFDSAGNGRMGFHWFAHFQTIAVGCFRCGNDQPLEIKNIFDSDFAVYNEVCNFALFDGVVSPEPCYICKCVLCYGKWYVRNAEMPEQNWKCVFVFEMAHALTHNCDFIRATHSAPYTEVKFTWLEAAVENHELLVRRGTKYVKIGKLTGVACYMRYANPAIKCVVS